MATAMSKMNWKTALALILVFAVFAGSYGCRKAPPPLRSEARAPQAPAKTSEQEAATRAVEAAEGKANQASLTPTGAEPGDQAAATTGGDDDDPEVADGDEEDAEDSKDYWKNIKFDRVSFDEVLDYVDVKYIDASSDHKRAWIEAANFALMVLDGSEELVPTAFYQARKGTPDEEGRLDGKTDIFACAGKALPNVVLHHIPSDEYLKASRPVRKKGRLSNEEVQTLRDRSKARSQSYNDAWKAVPFGKAEFECAMTYALAQIAAYQAKNPPVVKAGGAKSTDAKAAVGKKGDPAKPAAEVAKSAPAKDADKKEADKKDEDKRLPPDPDRAWEAAASGYLYALDPHSSVIPRRAWDDSNKKTENNSFEGIGAVLTQRDDLTIIENPMEGRPAYRAGLRAGDVIHKVDDVDVTGWVLGKVVKHIRGPHATKVKLSISRESEPDPKDYVIAREQIEVKNIDGELLHDYPGIARVKMAGFISSSKRDLRALIDKLASQAPGGKLQGLVLDLRLNSGGLLSQAIDIADMFLPKGRIVTVKYRRAAEEAHNATPSASDYTFPLVVLVNDGSASASEIVASAMQDNQRGLVVGLRTFGKASVQTLFEPTLHPDYYIKLTVARYYAPSGQTIQVVGVTPDVQVAPEVDGKIPVGFREENLNNHLIPIEGEFKSPWLPQMAELNKCIAEQGRADKLAKQEPKPQIRPDYQLLKAADYLGCLAKAPTK